MIFTRFPVFNGCIVTFTGNKSLQYRFSIYSIIYLGSDKSMMKTMTLCTETFLVPLKSINLKSFESSCNKDERNETLLRLGKSYESIWVEFCIPFGFEEREKKVVNPNPPLLL